MLDAQVRAAAVAHAPPALSIDEAVNDVEEPSSSPAAESADYQIQTDPTMANAGMTELDDAALTSSVTEHVAETASGLPTNGDIDIGAANAAAENNWDPSTNNDLSASQEWVEVERDAAETDTGLAATPAATTQTQSWADEQPDMPSEVRLICCS